MAPFGVRVLASCPGVVQTRFGERAAKKKLKGEAPHKMTARFAAEQIWGQIQKRKSIHLFDWYYRLMTCISKLLPKRVLFPLLRIGIQMRGGKTELLLSRDE
jgi:short-subunit dehydrogenase